MCDLDFDEYCTVWEEHLIGRARKEHRCDTCKAVIPVGASYLSHFDVFDGKGNHEKQCIACRTIGVAFWRVHHQMIGPSSLLEFLEQCLDEERWAVDEDEDDDDQPVMRNRLPSRLSDEGLRWKYAMAEICARSETARRAA